MRVYKPKLAALILVYMCVLTGQEVVAQPSQGCDRLHERSYDKAVTPLPPAPGVSWQS